MGHWTIRQNGRLLDWPKCSCVSTEIKFWKLSLRQAICTVYAKIDCPVACQNFSLLATAHDCETGLHVSVNTRYYIQNTATLFVYAYFYPCSLTMSHSLQLIQSPLFVCLFVFQSYLLSAYYFLATDDYDVNWTTAHCTLCLKLISMLCWIHIVLVVGLLQQWVTWPTHPWI